ncbi:SICA antigen [Plasmodium coatneyi]|uniref:SICA antigen n=1 Tax=Plasmodium coatneyi TaxID=208452 RepID=A0A1B1DTH2_9APIC|nr:SICA antigen [Plasmodium coatneyi]ANQ06073.1 SICA antigen [Plasmodium coatneyi]
MVDEVEKFFRARWTYFMLGIDKEKVYRLLKEFNTSLIDENDVDGYIAVCEDVVPGYDVTDQSLHKCFCKALIRNLVKVTNGSRTYTYKDTTLEVQNMKPNAPCDILNLWLLLYILKYGVQGNDILYVFTAISNLSEVFNPMEHENCKYTGTFTAELKKDGSSIFKDIYNWFLNHGTANIRGAMDSKTACNEKSRKDDPSGGGARRELGNINSKLEKKLQEVLEVIEELLPIVEEIEGEAARLPPPPSPPGEECKDKPKLCDRVTCVAEKWKGDKHKTDYNDIWGDIQARVPDLFNAISKPNPDIDKKYCYGTQWTDGNVTFAEMEACRYIARGLRRIYSTKTDGEEQDDRAKNDQKFKRTMECLLLNAYADLLKEKLKDRCSVERGITRAFNKSTQIKNETDPCKGDNSCTVCFKEEYKDCEIGGQNVKGKAKEMLDQQQDEIQKFLQEICKDCSKENGLCKRAQCVTTNWFRDRLSNAGDGRQNWCQIWGDRDVGKVLGELSTAMKTLSTNDSDLCQNITGTNGASAEVNMKVCQYITKGLERIYNFSEHGSSAQEKKNNRIFDQTMGCIILNIYADMLEKQSCISEDVINQAFGKSEQIKDKVSICNGDSKCFECKREVNLNCKVDVDVNLWYKKQINGKDCETDKGYVKKKVEELFKSNAEITETLGKICPEDEQSKAAKPEEGSTPAPPPAPSAAGSEEGRSAVLKARRAAEISNKIDPSHLTSYVPLAPAMIGITVMSYMLWQYFAFLGKGRKRFRRAPQIRSPSLQEQLLAHVDDQADGPHAYTLVKERKPRSTPKKRRKKRDLGRPRAARRGVRRRMIIDIHLEVLDECQKRDLHLMKEDFFEILVKEFMGCEFIKEGFIPKKQVSMVDVPKETVPSSDSGFREEDFVPKGGVAMEQDPCSDSGFREEDFVPEGSIPKEQVPSSDSGFSFDIPKEQVPSSDSGFREEDFCC